MKLEKTELSVSEREGRLTVQGGENCPDRAQQVCSCYSKEQHFSCVEHPGNKEGWCGDKSSKEHTMVGLIEAGKRQKKADKKPGVGIPGA